jgi:hypothetical protein
MFIIALLSRKMSQKNVAQWFAFVCILWALIFGLRGYHVGNDTIGYANFFQNKNIPYVNYGNVTRI